MQEHKAFFAAIGKEEKAFITLGYSVSESLLKKTESNKMSLIAMNSVENKKDPLALAVTRRYGDEEEEEEESPMCGVLEDIASLILRRLCLEDQIQLRSCSRRWLTLGRGTAKPHLQVPWVMIHGEGLSPYFLYNPATKKSHLFESAFPNNCPSHPQRLRAQVLAASQGWIMAGFPCCLEKAFLYNPFSRSVLDLPAGAAVPPYQFWRCPSYAFHLCPVEGSVDVYTATFKPGFALVTSWSSGEKAWSFVDSVAVAHDTYGSEWANLSLVCSKGALFCYFSREKVVVFRRSRAGGFARVDVELPENLLPRQVFLDNASLCLFEGDLYVVSRSGFPDPSRGVTWHVARLDLGKRSWVFGEESGRAFFHGNEKVPAVLISEPAEEFVGRFVSSMDGGRGIGRCLFSKAPVSCVTGAAKKEDSFWSFPWPSNVLRQFDLPRLRNLNAFWVETPTP